MAINFDKIWSSVKKNASTAKDIAELRIRLTRTAKEVDGLYRDLGCICYKNVSECCCETDESTSLICDSITAKNAEIEEIKNALSKLEGGVICPACGKSVKRDFAFCPFCGAAVPKEEPAEEAATETDTEVGVQIDLIDTDSDEETEAYAEEVDYAETEVSDPDGDDAESDELTGLDFSDEGEE